MIDAKEFIEQTVKLIVDTPEEVKITVTESEQLTIYELRVDKGDMGMVIGKHGKNIGAIRTLLAAMSAAASKKRVSLELLE
jgi:predicted RNA-binding protein YlqC (UPF0109 family)